MTCPISLKSTDTGQRMRYSSDDCFHPCDGPNFLRYTITGSQRRGKSVGSEIAVNWLVNGGDSMPAT